MLNFTFKFFIPVFSFSSDSKEASQFLPSVFACLSLSISLLYPVFIILPSFNESGLSSFIALSIISIMSSSLSRLLFVFLISSDSKVFKASFIGLIIFKEADSDRRSLVLAFFVTTLDISLSRSYIGFKYSLSSSLSIYLSKSSATASCLFIILSLFTSGCSKKPLSILAPIAVFVLSSTPKSEPFFFFSLIVSTNSRFLLELVSTII